MKDPKITLQQLTRSFLVSEMILQREQRCTILLNQSRRMLETLSCEQLELILQQLQEDTVLTRGGADVYEEIVTAILRELEKRNLP